MQQRAQKAFITYLRSIHIQKDKEVFDLTKLPVDEFSASLGLPLTPKIVFLNQKKKGKLVTGRPVLDIVDEEDESVISREKLLTDDLEEEDEEDIDILEKKDKDYEGKANLFKDDMYASFLELLSFGNKTEGRPCNKIRWVGQPILVSERLIFPSKCK